MNAAKKWLLAGMIASVSFTGFMVGWEGEEQPYHDAVGVLTVCNGHTGPDIIKDKIYTKADCDALLKKDLTTHGLAVLRCVTVPLNQNQYNAFVSLTYNVGAGNFCKSGLKEMPPRKYLIDLLNEGDYTGACDRIMAYNKVKDGPPKLTIVNGRKVWKQPMKPLRGLTLRRASEREMCLTPINDTPEEINGHSEAA